jgi:hypothetical protein
MEKEDKEDGMMNEGSREQFKDELCSLVYSISKAPVQVSRNYIHKNK